LSAAACARTDFGAFRLLPVDVLNHAVVAYGCCAGVETMIPAIVIDASREERHLMPALAAANSLFFSVFDNLLNLLTCASVTISATPAGAIFDGR
jgi:hypothetical protein